MKFEDRLLALAAMLGYKAPFLVSDHAAARFKHRFDLPMSILGARVELQRMLPEFRLVHVFGAHVDDRENASIWEGMGVKIVVSKSGTVLTVLPPEAERVIGNDRRRAAQQRKRNRRA